MPIYLLACCGMPIGLVLLGVVGVMWVDPLTYTEFFDELQQNLNINPPIIDVKETLWLHRIVGMIFLLIVLLGCAAVIGFSAMSGQL